VIDQALVTYIKALGTDAGTRVRTGNVLQEDAYPVVVVTRTGGTEPRTLGGTALFARGNYTFSVITDQYTNAYSTAQAINAALKSYTGMMGSTQIQSSRCLATPSDQSVVDGDRVIRFVAQDFLFVYLET
jgi:hypothetical protein